MTVAAHEQPATPDSRALPREGLILLVLLTILWGANWPVMKIAVAEVEPWTFRTVCLLVGAAGQFAIATAFRQRIHVPRRDLKPLLLASFFNIVVWHLATAFGLAVMEAGRASLIAYTMPLWVTLLSVAFLGERVSKLHYAGLALGLGGLGLLLIPAFNGLAGNVWGPVLMLVAALTWAVGTIVLKRVNWGMSVVQLTGWQLLIGAVPMVLGMTAFGRPSTLLSVSWTAAIALLYASVVAMVFCHYAWFKIVQLFPASIAAVSMLAVPPVGLFSSAWLLAEPIGPPDILALLLVMAGLALVLILPGLLSRRARPDSAGSS